jgi:hypothetical protein
MHERDSAVVIVASVYTVQLGTVFFRCPERGTNPLHKNVKNRKSLSIASGFRQKTGFSYVCDQCTE